MRFVATRKPPGLAEPFYGKPPSTLPEQLILDVITGKRFLAFTGATQLLESYHRYPYASRFHGRRTITCGR